MHKALRGWFILAGIALGVVAAWSQEVGEPVPEIYIREGQGKDTKPENFAERYKHHVVVMVSWSSMDPGVSTQTFKLLDELHEKYNQRGVIFIALTPEGAKTAQNWANERKPKFEVWFGLDLDRHWNFPAPPSAYIVDAFGRIAYARFNALNDGLEEKIQDVLQRTPPPNATPESLQKHFERVAALMQAGEVARAFTRMDVLATFFRNSEDETIAGQVERGIVDIRREAQRWLEEARTEIGQQNHASACRNLAALSVRLRVQDDDDRKSGRKKTTRRPPRPSRPPSGRRGADPPPEEIAANVPEIATIKDEVDIELGKLQSDNYTKAVVRKALDNARGEVLNDQAADLLELRHFSLARGLYREVIDKYRGTEAAEAAQQALDRLSEDPALRDDLRRAQLDEQAFRWFDIAERFASVHLYDQAKEYFERIVKECPQTAHAEKARTRLKELPKQQRDWEKTLKQRETFLSGGKKDSGESPGGEKKP